MAAEIHIDHMAISAPKRVLDELVDFYRNILEMELGPAPDIEGLQSRWLYSGTSALLHLIEDEDRHERGRNSFDHIAFRCANLETTILKLQQHDIEFARFDAPQEGQVLLFIQDPAGTSVELNFLYKD